MHLWSIAKREALIGLPRGETVEKMRMFMRIILRISLGRTTLRRGAGVTIVMVFGEDIVLVADVSGGDEEACCALRCARRFESARKKKFEGDFVLEK